MKATVRRGIVDNGQSAKRNSALQTPQSQSDRGYDALCVFLRGSLAAAQDAIEHTLSLQQAMMEVMSQHVFRLSDGDEYSGVGSEGMQEMVTAMQSDDLIRQNYENLARALAVMSQAVKDVHTLDELGPDLDGSLSDLSERWNANLLNVLLLEEMRQRFASRLKTLDGD